MTGDGMKKAISVLDWFVTVVLMLAGVWVVYAQWPSPEWWAWVMLVGGILGVPLNLFNPMQRVRTFLLRKLIRR